MRDGTVVVTGATGGIGREIALGVARAGAGVVLVARSRERAAEVAEEIAAAGGTAHLVLADLSSLAEVRRAAGEIRDRYPRVDGLVNNAAVYSARRQETTDGLELQLAVNHLAPFLLTRLLLDRLGEAGAARVVTLSSEAHRQGRVPWDDLQGRRRYGALRRYCDTKLMNLLFTAELARRAADRGVTANAVHPGVVGTELLFGGFAPLRLFRRFLRTPEQGARTAVWLATSPAVAGVTGRYFKDERELEPAPRALDAGEARRLWEESERLTGLAPTD